MRSRTRWTDRVELTGPNQSLESPELPK